MVEGGQHSVFIFVRKSAIWFVTWFCLLDRIIFETILKHKHFNRSLFPFDLDNNIVFFFPKLCFTVDIYKSLGLIHRGYSSSSGRNKLNEKILFQT